MTQRHSIKYNDGDKTQIIVAQIIDDTDGFLTVQTRNGSPFSLGKSQIIWKKPYLEVPA